MAMMTPRPVIPEYVARRGRACGRPRIRWRRSSTGPSAAWRLEKPVAAFRFEARLAVGFPPGRALCLTVSKRSPVIKSTFRIPA